MKNITTIIILFALAVIIFPNERHIIDALEQGTNSIENTEMISDSQTDQDVENTEVTLDSQINGLGELVSLGAEALTEVFDSLEVEEVQIEEAPLVTRSGSRSVQKQSDNEPRVTINASEFGDVVTPSDFGAIENDASTTTNLQEFFDYVRDNDVVGDFRGDWHINDTIIIDGPNKTFICGNINTNNLAGLDTAVSIETTFGRYIGQKFKVVGSGAAAYSVKNNKTGIDFTNSGSRNTFDCDIEVIGFTGYGINLVATGGGSNIMESFGRIKITACGSTGSGYTNGSAIATVSSVVNSGSANSVNQFSTITVDTVDPNWVEFELLEIDGKVHTIKAVNGLNIDVYPWVDNSFTGTIYGLHGGLMVGGSDSASIHIRQIDAIRCGSGARLGGLYGTNVEILQTQACGIGLSIGRDEKSNNLGSRIGSFYNEGSNTFDFVQVSRVNTNTQLQMVTGMNTNDWFVLEPQPNTFDASKRRISMAVLEKGHWYTRKNTEFPANQLNKASTTTISNNIANNQAVILDDSPIFELKWDEKYNSFWGNDFIKSYVFGTGNNHNPTGTVTFKLDSDDEAAGIRINDNGSAVTTLTITGVINPLSIIIFFDYAHQEWIISYRGEAPAALDSTQFNGASGGFVTLNSTDNSVLNGEEVGGIIFRSDDVSFADGDEVLSRLVGEAIGGGLGVGSNSKVDLVYQARNLETQNYTEKLRLGHDGTIEAKKFKLSTLNTAPSSATDTGTPGEVRITEDYIYVCIATNTWKRVAISSW